MLSRKLFLSITLAFALAISAVILPSPTAQAARPAELPACDFGSFDWQAKLDEKVPDWQTEGYSVAIQRIAGPQFVALYVMKGSDATNFNQLSWNGSYFSGSHRGTNGGALWLGYDNGSQVDFDTAWSNQRGGDQVHCMTWFSGNLILDPSVTSAFPDFDPITDIPNPNSPTEPEPPVNNSNPNNCDPWDVVCWFQNVVGNVVDGFQSLGDLIAGAFQAMGDWIANIIMPQNEDGTFTNQLTEAFTTISDGLSERLGFLTFPFEFIADLFSGVLTAYNPSGSDWTTCPDNNNISIPNLLGSNGVTLDMCTLEDVNPAVYQTVVGLIRVVWVIGVVGFLHHKYFSVVKA